MTFLLRGFGHFMFWGLKINYVSGDLLNRELCRVKSTLKVFTIEFIYSN